MTDAGLLAVVSRPREAGTPDAARARGLLAERLRALGYEVEEHPFRFTPAALLAFPVFGAGLGWLGLLSLPLLAIARLPAWAALACWVAGLVALGLMAWGIGLGGSPLDRGVREDANLIARRPGAVVRRWIVAHVDTKAQGHSMAGRLVAVWAVIVAIVLVTTLAALRLRAALPTALAGAGAAAAVAAGFLAGRGRLRGLSAGARDNGSGLVAALTAAELAADPAVGIVLTGAEEFGLVGARSLARDRPELLRGAEAVNVDTVDEEGPLFVVSHDPPGEALARLAAPVLAPVGPPVRLRRLPLGIFVDSHPLARGGAASVTIGRLTWRTLRLIHTPRDTADGLSFETARAVGRALAGWEVPGGPDPR